MCIYSLCYNVSIIFPLHCWERACSKLICLHLLFTKHVTNDIWVDLVMDKCIQMYWPSCSPFAVDQACSLLCFLKSTINYFVLLTLRERLLSGHHNASSLTSSDADSSLLVIRPTTAVSAENLMMELVWCSHTVVGEQGVQQRTEDTPLGGPSVEPMCRMTCCQSSQPVVCPSGSPGSSCRG